MTGFLLRGLSTLVILVVIAFGILYAFKAAESEEPYEVKRLWGDAVELVRQIGSSKDTDEGSADDGETSASTDRSAGNGNADSSSHSDPRSDPPRDAPRGSRSSRARQRGRDAFDAGDFERAVSEWTHAQARQPDPATAHELATAQLFAAVTRGWKREYFFADHPLAYLRMKSGDVWECRVVEDDGDTIRIKRPNGAGGPIPASRIREKKVYPPDRHAEGFEAEYRRRLDAMHPRTGGWCLALAKWCFERKLDAHLPYLLRTAYEEETLEHPIIEAEFLARWETSTASEREAILEVLEKFYPRSPRVQELRTRHLGLDGSSPDRPGPIGSRHVSAPSGDLARRAEEALRVGREHYRQAAPGSPGAAGHRDDAIEALREAQRLFEELAASGSDAQARYADGKLTDVIYMIAQLRKDAPIK